MILNPCATDSRCSTYCTIDRDVELFRLTAPAHLSPMGAPLELPLNHAYLVVNGTVVTNHLKSLLQENYEATIIRKYIKKKTSLDDATIDKIDWHAIGQNLQRQHLFNQIRLIKFMHNWLHCKTAPVISDVLTYKLSQWMNLAMGNIPSVQCDNLGQNLSLAIEEQAEIGWENFVKGREQWMRKLITGVWQIFYDVWKACNAHLRSPLGTSNTAHLNKCIKHVCGTLSHDMSWTYRLLFSTSLHD
eukprot:11114632-Ditylum_brightwellii.AAC.1